MKITAGNCNKKSVLTFPINQQTNAIHITYKFIFRQLMMQTENYMSFAPNSYL